MILVADQNRTSADLLVRRLRVEGLEAQAVGSVPLAERVIQAAVGRSMLEAMVLDPVLPGGGLGLLRNLRQDPKTASLPVIVFATSDTSDDLAQAWKAGASAFLVKGRVTPSQLVERVKSLMAGKAAPAPSPAHAEPESSGEYYLWLQPQAGDAARLSSDLGNGAGVKCPTCRSVLTLYVKRDPSRWGEWLVAKLGCLVCAKKRTPSGVLLRQPAVESQLVGGAS